MLSTPQKIAETIIGYHFREPSLLLSALTHSSYLRGDIELEAAHGANNNERLEFLGDAVLSAIVAHKLWSTFPQANEGQLSRWRAQIVCDESLSQAAEAIRLGDLLILGPAEERSGRQKKSITAAAVEALIAALYLDGGFSAAERFVSQFVLARIDLGRLSAASHEEVDAKTHLQELLQSQARPTPQYLLESSQGPSHAPEFVVRAFVDGKAMGAGKGTSKKRAEQEAARATLEMLRAEGSLK